MENPSLNDMLVALSEPIPELAPVSLIPIETGVSGLTAEYVKHNGRAKVHFFGDPKFPDNFRDVLLEMISLQRGSKPSAFAEYVPEAKSWYFEFTPSPAASVGTVMEFFMKKLAGLVGTDEQRHLP